MPTSRTPIKPSFCRYCRAPFLPRSSGGTKQEFCTPAHRKLFDKYGNQSMLRQVARIHREATDAVRIATEKFQNNAARGILSDPGLSALLLKNMNNGYADVERSLFHSLTLILNEHTARMEKLVSDRDKIRSIVREELEKFRIRNVLTPNRLLVTESGNASIDRGPYTSFFTVKK